MDNQNFNSSEENQNINATETVSYDTTASYSYDASNYSNDSSSRWY